MGVEHVSMRPDPLWQPLQVLAESKAQTVKAQLFLAQIKGAYPEVLRAIKTTQLAQELLLYKEEMLQEIGETGASFTDCWNQSSFTELPSAWLIVLYGNPN